MCIEFGAHIDVIMLGMVQHSIQTDRRGDADGAGGQAGIAVGVVGRVDSEVFIGDPAQPEVLQCKLYGGVGLQWHAGMETVDVQAGHHRFLRIVVGFFLDDRGKCAYLFRGHTDGFGLVEPLLVPESLMFLVRVHHQM